MKQTTQNPATPTRPAWQLAVLGFLLLSLAVGLTLGAVELWSRPWYRWFPLALVAAALLGWRGWRETREDYEPLLPGPWQAAAAGYGIGFLLLLLAAAFGQPGLSFWALPAVVAGLAVARGSWPLLVGWLPALVMLLAIAPLPFEPDRRAIQLAERFILGSADRMLFSLGVPHLRGADGFELAALNIPMADLLPGLAGMVGVLGLSLAWMLWRGRKSWHILVALALLAMFVLPLETMRTVFGIQCSDVAGSNFPLGWRGGVVMAAGWLAAAGLLLALDQFLVFLAQWKERAGSSRTAEHWRLWAGTPALLYLAGMAAFAVYLWRWDPARVRPPMLEVADAAFKAGQHARALQSYRGALRLQASSDALYQFRIALCTAALGRREEAVKLLLELAPPDKPGYGPAHALMARELMALASKPEHLVAAETHLNRALQLEPGNNEARAALGRLYLQLGRWDDARRELKEVVATYPELALGLAVAEQARADEPAARAWAERAAKHFAGKLGKADMDDPEARIGQAKALGVMGQFEAAVALVQAGQSKGRNPAYEAALSEIAANWAASLEATKPAAIAERLGAVQLGLTAAPANDSLLQALGRLTAVKGPAAEPVRNVVTELLASGTNAPALHFSLGALARQNGELEQARTHFEIAYAAAPHLPDIANNLATVLVVQAKPEPARALAILEPLLARFPENPYYRDTRGHALLALGKPKEAVLELEFALPLLPDKAPTHRALAEVYRQLNMPALAAEHTRLAATNAAPAKGGLGGN